MIDIQHFCQYCFKSQPFLWNRWNKAVIDAIKNGNQTISMVPCSSANGRCVNASLREYCADTIKRMAEPYERYISKKISGDELVMLTNLLCKSLGVKV
jgi:hypothetical protein